VCNQTPRVELTLDMVPAAANHARAFIRANQCLIHDGSVLDDALLLVTEMVTNALLHGAAPLSLSLECGERDVEVRVRDGSAVLPRQRHPDVNEEGGRGMVLLAGVAKAWGVEASPNGGKEVWFRLAHPG
jgi:anti-sigma regulatory factor (Ser/Thr protein kinase)